MADCPTGRGLATSTQRTQAPESVDTRKRVPPLWRAHRDLMCVREVGAGLVLGDRSQEQHGYALR